jgi:hypothetical protein
MCIFECSPVSHGKATRYYGTPSDASAPASHGHWPWWLMGSLLRAVVHVRAVEALLPS